MKSRKAIAENRKKRLKIVIPDRSGFISTAFLKAEIEKNGEIGVPEKDWVLLDNLVVEIFILQE